LYCVRPSFEKNTMLVYYLSKYNAHCAVNPIALHCAIQYNPITMRIALIKAEQN